LSDGRETPPSPSAELPPTILHLETTESWRGRPDDSKLYMIARETAWRLQGMASVLYRLGIGSKASGGHQFDEFSFLGGALGDLALGLQRACAARWAAFEAEGEAALRKSQARKKAKNARREALA
jgi:hypothetical protein